MKDIQVMQGINLESDISSVIIHLKENEDITKLLDLIKGFHPIFIDEYKYENGSLIIRSKLTFLWREVGETLITLSKGEISYEKAREYIVEEIIRQRISSMSTIPLLYASKKKHLEVTPTLLLKDRVEYTKSFNRQYTVGVGRGSEIIYSISSSKDSKNAKEIQRDKWATNLMISRMGLPIPKWEVLDSEEETVRIFNNYNKPVVIKPTGLTGGKGVTTGIDTVEKAKKAFNFAKSFIENKTGSPWQTKIMIQEQVQGEDYRLLVVDGKLEIATKRIPAFITGDGKKNIKELIEETNSDPRRDITNPSHTLKPINIDQPLLDFLEEQNLTLESVPQKDEKVVVRKVASMSQGGITEDFTDQVGPEIRYIVESIASSVHAFVIGADVMCLDISKPLTKENGAILEINTMPEAYLNLFPVIGEDRSYVADTYIEKLLKDNHTKRIVAVGQFSKDISTLLKQKTLFSSYLDEEDRVGEYKGGEIRINSLDINKGLEKLHAIEALKVNASLDAIIINHRDWDDVRDSGLGFDKIDLLILSDTTYQDKEAMKTIRKYKRKGLIDKIKVI